MKLRSIFIALVAAGLGVSLLPTANAQPFEGGANTLFLGHSFFRSVADNLTQIVDASGSYPDFEAHIVFSGGQGGAPGSLWANRQKRRQATQVLASGEIELVGLTHHGEYNSGLQDYKNWVDLALSYNPRTSFFIGSPWAGSGPVNSLSQFKNESQMSAEYGSAMVQRLRVEYPGVDFYHLSYGLAMVELKEDFDNGELEDLTQLIGKGPARHTSLFTDETPGHAGTMAQDLMALVWLSELYGIDRRVSVRWSRDDTRRVVGETIRASRRMN